MEICYLIAFPDTDDGQNPAPERFKGLKDAPYFQPIDIDLVTLGEETLIIEGHAVQVFRQRYDGCVQMIECHFDLKDPFAASVLQERAKIQSALESKFVPTPHIQYGTRQLSRQLAAAGITHRYEEFDDDHSDVDYRMDVSLPFLYRALAP